MVIMMALTWRRPAVVEGRYHGIRGPVMGWNTWCTHASCGQQGSENTGALHDFCNETEVLAMAKLMIDEGLQKIGWECVKLSSFSVAQSSNLYHDVPRRSAIPRIQYCQSAGAVFIS